MIFDAHIINIRKTTSKFSGQNAMRVCYQGLIFHENHRIDSRSDSHNIQVW